MYSGHKDGLRAGVSRGTKLNWERVILL
jgi:hypothetical protein